MPRKPSSPSRRKASRGNCCFSSHSSTCGRISASQNSRSVRRMVSRSAETVVLIREILPRPRNACLTARRAGRASRSRPSRSRSPCSSAAGSGRRSSPPAPFRRRRSGRGRRRAPSRAPGRGTPPPPAAPRTFWTVKSISGSPSACRRSKRCRVTCATSVVTRSSTARPAGLRRVTVTSRTSRPGHAAAHAARELSGRDPAHPLRPGGLALEARARPRRAPPRAPGPCAPRFHQRSRSPARSVSEPEARNVSPTRRASGKLRIDREADPPVRAS